MLISVIHHIRRKESLQEVVIATINTNSTHQCEFCRTIVSNN